jgi:hypothetical protein
MIPENNKKPGVCYAWSDDGLELPVIDLTHPAFAFEISDAEVENLIEKFMVSLKMQANAPAAAMQAAAGQSILLRSMLESADTYTSGLMTYLNKLGPENLGEGYAGPIDRQWAASLTPVTFRWRMQDVARTLAKGLTPALQAQPDRALHLLNIGGGPAADSLNALLLIHKEHPNLRPGRQVVIHVLDLDRAGPSFGRRALQALLADEAPLQGLTIAFDDIPNDWSDTSTLRRLIDSLQLEQTNAACSSEGGLFEFASDADIVANLQELRQGTPPDFFVSGPVVRDASSLDPRLRITEHIPGRPAIRYLGMAYFGALVAQAGWCIDGTLDGLMHQVVRLMRSSSSLLG